MKKFQSQLKALGNGIIWWVGFVLVLIISSVVYATYSTLTVSTGDVLSKDKWNELVSYTVPPGWVMAFYGTSCPNGWSAADGTTSVKMTDGSSSTLDLRGEFIRGLDTAGVGARGVDAGRSLGSAQKGSNILLDWVDSSAWTMLIWQDSALWLESSSVWWDASAQIFSVSPASTSSNANTSWTRTVRPRNIALLYCVKN